MRFHRLGIFDPASGRALSSGWTGIWNRENISDTYQKGFLYAGKEAYIVPMDDEIAHWLRLHGESLGHNDECHQRQLPDDQRQAHLMRCHPGKLRHAGGYQHPHPDYPHVQLGGTFTWDHDPHPTVQAHMERVRRMGVRDLHRAHCGPI